MKYVGNVQSQANAEVYATASGTLPNGKPVVVNSDGTVSVISGTDQAVGTVAPYASAALYGDSCLDTNSNRVVIAYRNASNAQGTAIVGTINPANNSISFGTPVVFNADYNTTQTNATFDSNSNKVVITYQAKYNVYGEAIVGTVNPSDNSISFGTPVVYASVNITGGNVACFDSSSNRIVIAHNISGGSQKAVVGTVSGTGISFGTPVQYEAGAVSNTGTPRIDIVFDSNSNKVVIAFEDAADGKKGKAVVGTVSNTAISFGSTVVFHAAATGVIRSCFDSTANKVLVAYHDEGDSYKGKIVVGTVSSTSISFGSEVVWDSGANTDASSNLGLIFDSTSNVTFLVDSNYAGGYPYLGFFVLGTVSGTTISFGSRTTFTGSSILEGMPSPLYSLAAKRINLNWNIASAGKNSVIQLASTTLNAESYVGITNGVVDYDVGPDSVGSPVVFETSYALYNKVIFDTNSNRVVVSYRDNGNSTYGTAVVGTVNPANNSISFGTPVVYASETTSYQGGCFDSNSNKVVLLWQAGAGKSIVGTVNPANNSISFGSAVSFDSVGNGAYYISAAFDSSNNKVVIGYADAMNDFQMYGTAIVGTVSGTSISFGSAVVFKTSVSRYMATTFDSSNNKVVIAYRDDSNSNAGTAIVGTVSGTNISFGTAVVFKANSVNSDAMSSAFDSNSNKVVITYKDNSNNYGTASVGTVSGTGISFGTPVVFNAGTTDMISNAFDSTINKIVIAYRDRSNSDYGTVIVGTVSGTAISFGSELVFSNATYSQIGNAFDSNSNRSVIAYADNGNSSYGTAVVFQPAFDNTVRGEVASGSTAIIQAGGAVNTLQTGLTPGQQYFVQTDGTLSLTAGSPSVIAGTAVSATDLIVKG